MIDRFRAALLVLPLAAIGCARSRAPSFVLFGAYFPGWMLCALFGIAGSIGARATFVATGLAETLPFQLFVCVATGILVALLAWPLFGGG